MVKLFSVTKKYFDTLLLLEKCQIFKFGVLISIVDKLLFVIQYLVHTITIEHLDIFFCIHNDKYQLDTEGFRSYMWSFVYLPSIWSIRILPTSYTHVHGNHIKWIKIDYLFHVIYLRHLLRSTAAQNSKCS